LAEMKCVLCGGEYDVETCCVSSDTVCDDEETGQWVSMQGFVERRKCCKKPLGEGYGDMNFYDTKEEADKLTEQWKAKIGIWE